MCLFCVYLFIVDLFCVSLRRMKRFLLKRIAMKNDISMPVAHGQHAVYVVWSLAYILLMWHCMDEVSFTRTYHSIVNLARFMLTVNLLAMGNDH